MASIDKVKVGETTYDVSPSKDGTLNGYTSGDTESPASWTSVNTITTSDTNSTVFNKVTSMVKNIRWLYSKLGNTDFSATGQNTVTGALSSMQSSIDGKAPATHSHTVSDLPVSSSQVNSTNYIPTCALLYSMNEQLDGVHYELSQTGYQIGDVFTTRRILGDNWALCDGRYIDAYEAPEYYRQSRDNNYSYTYINDLDSEMVSIVVGNTPYSFKNDSTNSIIYIYKWEDTDGAYKKKLFSTINYTTQINAIQVKVLNDWVFIVGTYDAAYNTQKRCFFTASVADMQFYPISYLTEGTYDFPVGVGDSGSGIGTSGPYLSYCKIKSDGTYGVVINIWNCYSNSSGKADTMRFDVLELVNGKWMCVKAISSPLLTLIAPNYANIGILPFYNPYLDRWQMVYTSSAASKSYTYSLYSVDITSCYDSGTIATSTAVSNVWSGSDSTSGFSYDDGTAVYLVPSHYDEDDSRYGALKIVSETTTQVQTKNTYRMDCPCYKEQDGYFYVMGTGPIYRYDSFSDFLMNVNPVVISSVSWYTGSQTSRISVRDFSFNQGLYDLVVTGDRIATLGYNLPTISETGAYAYIKIKESMV